MAKKRQKADPRAWLGATQPTGTLAIVLFVPSKDRDGRNIAHELWVTRAFETLGSLFRGATAYPRARGVWRDDERSGELRYEEPTIITCYADPAALLLKLARGFAHSCISWEGKRSRVRSEL